VVPDLRDLADRLFPDRRVTQARHRPARAPRNGAGSLGLVTYGAERTRWKIRSDRTVDENPRIRRTIRGSFFTG